MTARDRKELRPKDLTVIIDNREQMPYDVAPMKMEAGTLPTADYSVLGLEHQIALERKSLPDLLGCIGGGRDRFEREMQRLLSYEAKAIVVEATWSEIEKGDWRQQVHPQAVLGSLLGWMAMGIPVIMAGDRNRGQIYAARFLFIAARRRWREVQVFCDGLKIAAE